MTEIQQVDMSLAYMGPARRITAPEFIKPHGYRQPEVSAYIRPWTDADTQAVLSGSGKVQP